MTDDEGCSTALVFTGQTAYCNGSALARTTQRITVAPAPAPPPTAPDHGVRVRVTCPGSAKPGGCKFTLQVVSGKPKKGKKVKVGRPRPESALAKLTLKAGHSGLVTLRPKAKFATRLASAKNVLVREAETIKSSTRTTYRRLKVVPANKG